MTNRVQTAGRHPRTKPQQRLSASADLARRLGLQVFHLCTRSDRAVRRGVLRVFLPMNSYSRWWETEWFKEWERLARGH